MLRFSFFESYFWKLVFGWIYRKANDKRRVASCDDVTQVDHTLQLHLGMCVSVKGYNHGPGIIQGLHT